MAASHATSSTTARPSASGLENTRRSVPPGYRTPMSGTAAIARTFHNPAWLATITQLIDSPPAI